MKNIFSKRILVSIILIIMLVLISTGCDGPGGGGTTPPPLPKPCTLTVYSQNFWCYGYVWINGASTGQEIAFNGAVTITGLTAGTVANVQIVDWWGNYSHEIGRAHV